MITKEKFNTREEWSAARTTLGGSDAAAVIGKSPWMTNTELWEVKTGRRIFAGLSENELVQYGHDAEPLIRQIFELDHPEFEHSYTENTIFRNELYPFAHASVDGLLTDSLTGEKGILEIKTATIQNASQVDKWKYGHVPVYYLIQVLWYMAILNADFAVIVAQLKGARWNGEDCKVTVERTVNRADHASDITYLMTQGRQFWKYVQDDQRPPLILEI